MKAPPPKSSEEIELAKKKVEYVALLRASGGKVTWSGNTPATAGETFEVKVDGSRVSIRHTKKGAPDETEQSNRGLEDLALEYAARKLHTAAQNGFGR